MIPYTTLQMAKIFYSCNTATSLLATRNQLEELQTVNAAALVCYNLKMQLLLDANQI